MKKRTIYLSLLIISGFIYPSQVNSHVGSGRACFDMPGSVNRTSNRWSKNDPIPTYKGGKFGGGKSRKSLRCMHSGTERHKGPKKKDISSNKLCHYHFIDDGGRYKQADHFWKDGRNKNQCRKTPWS